MNNKKKLGIVEWTMHNHKIVLLLVALLVGIGIYALPEMPKKEYPDFTIRNGVVVGVYPGATSEQVEEQLTKPLEKHILGYKDVKKSGTYSMTRDGMVYIVLELMESVDDTKEFFSDLRLNLQTLKSQLPPGVLALLIIDEFADTSAILITLESDTKTYQQLSDLLEILEDRLRPLPIVSNLRRYGMQKEEINIYLDKDKLATYGINSQLVMAQLFAGGLLTSAGTVSSDVQAIPVHLNNSFTSIQEIQDQVVYFDPSGNILRVKDISRVVKEYSKTSSYITNNGRKCLLLSMEMSKGNNIVDLGRQVDAVLRQYESELPPDVSVFRIADQPQVVSTSVYAFLREMLIAILAVIAVIIIMLPLRVAAVAATSIPITIFISLGIMHACGFEINTVTLASLLVVLGMVVDDSIVVIDNYMTMLDKGMSRWKASITAAKTYFKSVFSATLAISITFFPFYFTFPDNFMEFIFMAPWTISITLTISLLVSMLYIPYVQYFTIRKGLHQVAEKQRMKSKKGRSMLEMFEGFYERTLRKAFARPVVVIVSIALILILPFFVYPQLPHRLMPMADRNQFVVEFYLPFGSSLEETGVVSDSLRRLIQTDKRVISVTSFVGQGSPRFQATYSPQMPGSNFAQFIVNTPSHKVTEELVREYQAKYMNYFPNTYVRVRRLDYSLMTSNEVEVRLQGQDKSALMRFADTLTRDLRELPYIAQVRSDFWGIQPGVNINVNETEAARVGINPGLLSLNLASRYTGIPVTSVWEGKNALPVNIRTDRSQDPPTPERLGNEYVQGLIPGVSVPLRQVATISPDWHISQIVRRNGFPTLTLMMDMEYGKISSDVFHLVQDVVDKHPAPDGITVSYGGTYTADKDLMPGILKGVAIAILMIFLILLFHFQKISLALLVLASTSLSILGAFVGTWIMGLNFSLTSFLGLVSLIGLVVRNGILMFDYAEELRSGGISVKEAAFKAGCRRIRPIFLTSAAASMGVIPMIISNDTLWAPMATVICFGVMTAMFFVSFALPVVYWLIYRKQDKSMDIVEPENI